MRIARGVREVVFPIIFMHPGCFEEATVVIGGIEGGGIGRGGEDGEVLDGGGEGEHVGTEFGDAGLDCWTGGGFHC